jgi:hypothetical protein
MGCRDGKLGADFIGGFRSTTRRCVKKEEDESRVRRCKRRLGGVGGTLPLDRTRAADRIPLDFPIARGDEAGVMSAAVRSPSRFS